MNRRSLAAFSILTLTATSLAVAKALQMTMPAAPLVPVTALAPVQTAPALVELAAAPAVPPAPVVHQALAFQAAPEITAEVAAKIDAEIKSPEFNSVAPIEEKKAPEPAIVEAAAPPPPPPITLVAKIDLATQRMTVLENGKPRFTWTVSSGAKGFDTPRGTFKPEWMAKLWHSRKYDNAPMPHSVFFKDGAAIHATMNMGSLGTPASHGCVRLSPTNAATFFALVRQHSMVQTRIQVFGTPRHSEPAIASRQPSRAPQYGYVAAPVRQAYAQHGYAQHAYAQPAYAQQAYVQQSYAAAPRPVGASRVGGYYGNGGSNYAPRAIPAARNLQPAPRRIAQASPRGVRY